MGGAHSSEHSEALRREYDNENQIQSQFDAANVPEAYSEADDRREKEPREPRIDTPGPSTRERVNITSPERGGRRKKTKHKKRGKKKSSRRLKKSRRKMKKRSKRVKFA